MHIRQVLPVFFALCPSLLMAQTPSSWSVVPASLQLRGRDAIQRVLVMESSPVDARDRTRQATFRSLAPSVFEVSSSGVITSKSTGKGDLQISYAGVTRSVAVQVRDADVERPISFQLDIQPILTARGCNAGACHGKARGQNGFQLSLLGFDSDFDFDSLTKNARGRRLFPAVPAHSLLLRKAAATTPHGGGVRLPVGSYDYRTVLSWIEAGAPRRQVQEPTLTHVSVFPEKRILEPKESQQLLVTAHFSDGTHRDVTHATTFQSNEAPVVGVDKNGLIQAGPIPGEATLMARYMGMIATCKAMIPLPKKVDPKLYAALPRVTFIDDLVWKKLESLRITPSARVDDARFLRRAHLDIIGRLPTPAEIRAFLKDKSSDKRQVAIDRLLKRPEYADHWANQWADLLRPNPYRVGIKAVFNYDNWIRDSFRRNKPYDQFVRELITARGSTWYNGAATLFRDRRSPDEVTTLVTQLFLGIRLECAKCHHHPFEKWSQDDFYSFAAFFSRVGRKGTGLSPPISGGEEIVMTSKSGSVRHPLTNQVLAPRPLFGEPPKRPPLRDGEKEDPREVLADWITSKDNDYFAQTIVNRVWATMMGRGLVEPVDDLRATNPPSNGPLLRALASEFRRQKYDLKKLIRTIAISHVYQLSSLPTDRNVADTRNYSRHYRVRLRAEVLLDAVSDITEVPATFSAMPERSRANQIWTHRVSSLFLDTFGRPDPNQDPPCERNAGSTVTQALHLMNSPKIHSQVISDAGRAARLSKLKDVGKITEELYLLTYSRLPSDKEKLMCEKIFQSSKRGRRKTTEDILWALINTPEFVFKD